MSPKSRVVSAWRNLVHRNRVERELDEELRAAVDVLVDDQLRKGLPPGEARRAALRQLGGVESVKERVREVRSGAFIDTLLRDLRYGARILARNPIFTLTAILSVAVGIGATDGHLHGRQRPAVAVCGRCQRSGRRG
jgi:hypothetical protein